MWMFRTTYPFSYGEGAFIERAGTVVVSLGFQQQREVVEAGCGGGVVRAEHLLPDGEGAFIERAGTVVVSLGIQETREVVEADGGVGVVRAEHPYALS